MPDSTLYLYTSLTAGSSHIITATSRLETILKANKLPFRALDVATDDAARKLWGRRSKGKKLPGLVKFGNVVGDLEEIEEWNEYGELRMQIESVEDFGDSLPATSYPATSAATTSTSAAAPASAPKQSTIKIQNPPSKEEHKEASIPPALRQAGEEAAAKAKQLSSSPAPAAPAPAPAASTPAAPTPAAAVVDEKSEESASKAEQSSSSPASAAPADPTPAAAPAADKKTEESKKTEEEPNRTAQAAPNDAQTTTAAEIEQGAAASTTVRRETSSVAPPEVNSSSSPKGGAESTPAEAGEAVGEEEAVGGEEKPGMGVSRPPRPRLVPEVAAESSANFHADSAQALGLVQHHRGSIVSATSPEEKKKVAQDLRTSVSGGQADVVESLRAEKATRGDEGEHEETIEEEPAGVDEMAARVQEARI
ncbi:hypothetical protein P168DRAFT_324569 [Aspergillus campestris IBT 28561]|uniref:Glutaredoxin domain-containing protein n=1 Tax=Aspergillus campestris (strain IBT 28561) TaxID=1392248 RepID=A0A2I1DB72_ASPC2|nr:uncharacterized protein P168DRAFT_324569 [Aspergillus campestris IBT 28561]PKY07126.1 hypothetical protein P168DRAFT_324569 [Aspergillus campestris IBT 28561]